MSLETTYKICEKYPNVHFYGDKKVGHFSWDYLSNFWLQRKINFLSGPKKLNHFMEINLHDLSDLESSYKKVKTYYLND